MIRKLISLGMLLLVLATLSNSALAQSTRGLFADNRMVINVTLAEKNQVLFEMRDFLHGLHNINLTLAKQDMPALAKNARPMGMLLERMPASLKERLPEDYTQLAIAMNEAFQNLARNAETKNDMRQTHEDLAEVMTYCSGCHDTFRFNVVAKRPLK